MDHAGLPLKTVLEQLDLLGEEVVPVLRREFAALKPAHVPDAPTHASLVAAASSVDDTASVGTTSSVDDTSLVEPVETTRMTTIVVVSAGLSVPSSTRILADSLGCRDPARALRRWARTRRSRSSSCATWHT